MYKTERGQLDDFTDACPESSRADQSEASGNGLTAEEACREGREKEEGREEDHRGNRGQVGGGGQRPIRLQTDNPQIMQPHRVWPFPLSDVVLT